MDWTDEAIQRLRELWAQGLSASQIGVELGCNKNQVLGKVHRLHLSMRQNPVGKGQPPRWTDEETQFLRDHPAWSDVKIGVALGKDTKTVNSQRRRLGIGRVVEKTLPPLLSLMVTPPPKVKSVTFNAPRVSKEKAPMAVARAASVVVPFHATNMALRQYPPQRECLFPVGEPSEPGFRFCCERVTTPGPYCEEHRAVCFMPVRVRAA